MRFTFEYLQREYEGVLRAGYQVLTCDEFRRCAAPARPALTLVNRVDVDLSVRKAGRIARLFNTLGIKASFFVRLHAPEYNPFSFENFKTLKSIRDAGHEIGYHAEIVDEAAIWGEQATDCLQRDIRVLQEMLGIEIKGAASHGGLTGLDNLDFWRANSPASVGLSYEAYDTQPEFDLFAQALYVSDSEWTRWKCYDKGQRVVGDERSPSEHACDKPPLLYLLVHPDTYYDAHCYEAER